MNQSRRMLVLRTIVEDYIRSHEPVGSTALVRNHHLGVSSATVRNDMALLEDEGYLEQPHTSAGRVPTEKGYRYFVDRLTGVAPLSAAQRQGIRDFLDGSTNLQDTLQRAARLLASITGQIAVVTAPSLTKTHIRHIEFVAMSMNTVLLIVITDAGRLAQHMITVRTMPSADELHYLGVFVNSICDGLSFHQAARQLHDHRYDYDAGHHTQLIETVAEALSAMSDEEHAGDLFMSGVSRLAERSITAELAPLFDALEEQVVLMRLMTTRSAGGPHVSVAIGSETHTPGLLHASVVSSGYGMSEDDDTEPEPVAFVGSIGPTHMDYAATMSAVQAVARYLTNFLDPDGTNMAPETHDDIDKSTEPSDTGTRD